MGMISRIKARRRRKAADEAARMEARDLLIETGAPYEMIKAVTSGSESKSTALARGVLSNPDDPVAGYNTIAGTDITKEGRKGRQARRDKRRADRQANKIEGATVIKARAGRLEERFEKRNKRLKKRQERRKGMRDFFLGEDVIPAEEVSIGGDEEFLGKTVGEANEAAASAEAQADEAREEGLLGADQLSKTFEQGMTLVDQGARQAEFGRRGQSALRDLIRETPSLAQAQADVAGERLREQQAVQLAAGGGGAGGLAAMLSGQVQQGEGVAAQTGGAVGAESIGRQQQLAGLLGRGRTQDLSQQRLGQQIEMAGVQNELAAQSQLLGAARARQQVQAQFKLGLQKAQLQSDLAIQGTRAQQKGKEGMLPALTATAGAVVGGVVGGAGGAKTGAAAGQALGEGTIAGIDEITEDETKAEGAR